MKPYKDENCECYKLEAEINTKYPKANWNVDSACCMWLEKSKELKGNYIEFAPYANENYGCTCPTCGRMICGWCV
jgi:hypothetical protein